MVEKFDEGMEHEEGKKERTEKHREEKDTTTAKNLDNLHASIDVTQQKNIFESEKNNETHEVKEHINELKSTVHVKHSSPIMKSPSYDNMSESDITAIAHKERSHSVTRVQDLVEKTTRIPNWIKKLTT